MKTITSTFVAGLLLASAGLANAGPVALTDAQMDGVTAGGTAIALGAAGSFGDWVSHTGAYTQTLVNDNTFAGGAAQSYAVAVSYLGVALAGSTAASTATLP
ncbi:MAG: hypothetical protein ACYC0P_03410 [Thiobacillus sp.]